MPTETKLELPPSSDCEWEYDIFTRKLSQSDGGIFYIDMVDPKDDCLMWEESDPRIVLPFGIDAWWREVERLERHRASARFLSQVEREEFEAKSDSKLAHALAQLDAWRAANKRGGE